MNWFDNEVQGRLSQQHSENEWGSLTPKEDFQKPELIDLSKLNEEYEYRQSFNKKGRIVIVRVKVQKIKR
jgi:hypothetical protein